MLTVIFFHQHQVATLIFVIMGQQLALQQLPADGHGNATAQMAEANLVSARLIYQQAPPQMAFVELRLKLLRPTLPMSQLERPHVKVLLCQSLSAEQL
jgi:hypothetical protein